MILINPDEASSILDQHLSSIERHLMLIKCDLESLQLKIVAGDVGTETQANKTIGRINHWVRSAIQTEMKIAEQKKQKAGLGRRGYGLDLDEERHQIGCRLDRLRQCSDETEISK
jgi:hypothetical protein